MLQKTLLVADERCDSFLPCCAGLGWLLLTLRFASPFRERVFFFSQRADSSRTAHVPSRRPIQCLPSCHVPQSDIIPSRNPIRETSSVVLTIDVCDISGRQAGNRSLSLSAILKCLPESTIRKSSRIVYLMDDGLHLVYNMYLLN